MGEIKKDDISVILASLAPRMGKISKLFCMELKSVIDSVQ